MGNFRSKKKVVPAEPPPPLTTLEQVLDNAEARERVTQAVAACKPGVASRWSKILEIANRKTMPTEEQPYPMNLEITLDTLKEILVTLFHEVKYISSDGLALARNTIPEMYDKHSLERGSRVSLKERGEKGYNGENFAYGELDHEIFATMYLKLVSVYGAKDGGRFYDLGCGVGTLVYTAAFIGTFGKVIGIELVSSLLERGERRMVRWEKLSQNLPSRIRDCRIEWIEDDFCINTYWTDGTFIFLHWTAFSTTMKSELSKCFCACAEGTHVVTFSSPLDDPHGDFLLLVQDTCDTSWGKAEFFLHEKITKSRQLTDGQ